MPGGRVLVSDDQDRALLAHVRPEGWVNPPAKPMYDLVVIGGGTAGLVCAAGAAGLGARVALVERARLGGDCLNTGCVPSKALLRSARVVGESRAGAAVGVTAETHVDFQAVMTRLRARRAAIAPNDSAARLASLGVDLFFGLARFGDRRTIVVGSQPLRFRKAVIASGSRPAAPSIEGLDRVPFLTSENLFEMTEQPLSLAILGGGPIGCEMAQAFARLGTTVTLIEEGPRLLPQEDEDAAAVVAQALARDGVELRLSARADRVAPADGGVSVTIGTTTVSAAAILIATGRTPNTDGLALEAAGVAYSNDGIRVDGRLRTTNRRVYASGDVASRYKFTHAADALSRVVVQNALFFGRKQAGRLVIPWCTFTSPEVAHVGLNSRAAAAGNADTITVPLRDVDRAVVDDETDGFVRIHHRRGRIAGATIVAPAAGEIIGFVAAAMERGAGLTELASTVFPYPTVSLALRQAGDLYRRSALTPGVKRSLDYYFRVRRWLG